MKLHLHDFGDEQDYKLQEPCATYDAYIEDNMVIAEIEDYHPDHKEHLTEFNETIESEFYEFISNNETELKENIRDERVDEIVVQYSLSESDGIKFKIV